MTAAEEIEHGPTPARHPLAPGATPTAISHHLLREDRGRFRQALEAAKAGGDADEVDRCMEHWRRVAVVERDRDEFVRIARRDAEQNTGEASPPDEPLALTRAKAGM